jgi:WD40 repeat protein
MATAEGETSRDGRVPPGGSVYDGFISYSHAADDLVAPRLQAGLQRFAKPWWKRRALRIFRDESSLSANPHLWSSITDALDTSDWFVLLLSLDAADSEWVNREVEYWLEHKDSNRIIPVVTDGEFAWSETDIDLESTAAPPALYGAFSDEPRWVDLRFARTEKQLDLNNPRFSAAVADVASAIHGVPKDELESEEVLQHRRTVRTAWAAGIGLLILSLFALGTAVYAIDQRNDARAATAAEAEQRQIAEHNETAAEAAAEAEAEIREVAQQRQAEAEQQAAIAHGRELVLEAEKTVSTDPELSAHLAIASLTLLSDAGENPAQAVAALRAALANDRIVTRLPGGDFVAVHPDGTLLATGIGNDAVVLDIASGGEVERYGREGAFAAGAAFSPDGNLLVVAFWDAIPTATVWDRTTGESFTLGTHPRGFPDLVFNPDGDLLAMGGAAKNGINHGLEVWSVSERGLVFEDELGTAPDFSPTGLMSYAEIPGRDQTAWDVRIVDPVSAALIDSFPTDLAPDNLGGQFTSWSPDDRRIAASTQAELVVLDADLGTKVARTRTESLDFGRPKWFGDSETLLAGRQVIDAATGEIRFELLGQRGGIGIGGSDVFPESVLVAAAALGASEGDRGEEVVLFDATAVIGEVGGWESAIEPGRSRGSRYTPDGRALITGGFADGSYLTAAAIDGSDPSQIAGGPRGFFPIADSTANGAFVFHPGPDGIWTLRATDTNEMTYAAAPGWSIDGASWDGTRAVVAAQPGAPEASDADCGPTHVVSTADGSLIAVLSESGCPGSAYFSPDGRLIYSSFDILDRGGLFDAETGELLVDLGGTPYLWFFVAFVPDGSKLLAGVNNMSVLDLDALLSGAPPDDAVTLEIAVYEEDGLVAKYAVAPDGVTVATSAGGKPVSIWDLETESLVEEIGGTDAGGFQFAGFHPDPSVAHLLVTSPPNEVRIYTLDIEELLAIATDGLSREMTEAECEQYFRGPCPTP